MKNQVIIIRLIVISLLAMTSCSNNITDTKERSIKVDSTKAKVDTTNSSSKIIPGEKNQQKLYANYSLRDLTLRRKK